MFDAPPAVVTVGAVHAGEANNVIPAEARLEISVRALDPQVRRSMEQRIRDLVRLQAASFGVRAEIAWRPGYAVLVNDALQTARALAVAQKHFPAEQINPQGPTTLTAIVDTGSGSIMSTIFGQVTTLDKQCTFMPTIGSSVVPCARPSARNPALGLGKSQAPRREWYRHGHPRPD